MPWFYYLGIMFILKPLLHMLTRWRVNGKENVPAHGPVIIVSNHLNLVDPPLLSASIKRRIVFMAKEELFHSLILGPLVRGWHAFPVRREGLDREALRQAQQVLGEGLALGMFPEGARSATAQLQRARAGTSLLALRSGVPVLPVGITGTEKIKSPIIDGQSTKAQLVSATDFIMVRIAELLPPSYRGVYGGDDYGRSIGD
jgi:1-acyl-sn-glycerol-3-phosphate acyltransferase